MGVAARVDPRPQNLSGADRTETLVSTDLVTTPTAVPPQTTSRHRGPLLRRTTPDVPVRVVGDDQLLVEGVRHLLRSAPGLLVCSTPHETEAMNEVVILVGRRVTTAALRLVQGPKKTHGLPRVILVTEEIDEQTALVAVAAGVDAVLTFDQAADARRLRAVVLAVARGEAVLPGPVQAAVTRRLRTIHRDVLSPSGLTPSGLTTRECDILRLVADGLDTNAIAEELRFSERTVKYALNHVMTRYGLRSRAQAVAHAVRHGAI